MLCPLECIKGAIWELGFGRFIQLMQKYLEYSQQDLDLIRRCTKLHKRSLSKGALKSDRGKTVDSAKKLENLQDTRKIYKSSLQQPKLDEMSTKKKGGQPSKKTLIQTVSEFAILEEIGEDSSLFKSKHLKQKASQNKFQQLTSQKMQQQILARIDQLKNRLQYRLFVNHRELSRRPAYGKYITCKYGG